MSDDAFIDEMIKRRLSLKDEAAPSDPEAVKRYPKLYVGMTLTDAGNGYIREPWTLSIKAGVGVWTATVRDDTLKYTCKVSSESLEGLWSALEAEFSKASPGWEPMKGKQPVMRRRRDPRG